MSTRTIKRAEDGDNALLARQLARYVDVCGADRETRAHLIELGQQARKRGGWWSAYKDLLPGPYVQLEAEASEVHNYEPLLVPGLLQTEEYAHAIASAMQRRPRDAERHVEARMRRQRRVYDGDLTVNAMIDEAVLQRAAVDDIGQAQLHHLAEMAALPNVRIRVLPWAAGLYPAAGLPIVMLRFASPFDPDLAMTETPGGEKYYDDAEEVAGLNAVLDGIDEIALPSSDTLGIVDRYPKRWYS